MDRHLTPQETITICKKTTKQTMTNHRAQIQTCKRYQILTRRATHLPTHKDSKALQWINGHKQETGVHKSHAQSYQNRYHAQEVIEKSQLQEEIIIKNRIKLQQLAKLKIRKLQFRIHQPSRRLRNQELMLQLFIMLSQSFPLQRKVVSQLITLTK